MTTAKPRICLTLEPHQFEILNRFSRVQGRPTSFALRTLLEGAWPVLEATTRALEEAANGLDAAKAAVWLESMQSAASAAEPTLSSLMDSLAGVGAPVRADAAPVEGPTATSEAPTAHQPNLFPNAPD